MPAITSPIVQQLAMVMARIWQDCYINMTPISLSKGIWTKSVMLLHSYNGMIVLYQRRITIQQNISSYSTASYRYGKDIPHHGSYSYSILIVVYWKTLVVGILTKSVLLHSYNYIMMLYKWRSVIYCAPSCSTPTTIMVRMLWHDSCSNMAPNIL